MTYELRNSRKVSTSAIQISCRSAPVLSGNRLGGYAAVFGQPTDLGGGNREAIAIGAFDQALKVSDVRALYNHSPMYVLGRQSAGTLRLSLDSTGLEYEVDLPGTRYAADLRELVERGDIDGASFAFIPDKVEFDRDSGITRHLSVAQLIDVSPVTFPAYAGASTEARSLPPTICRQRSQLIRARARVRGF
jgi:HK97 family phage prohead protease